MASGNTVNILIKADDQAAKEIKGVNDAAGGLGKTLGDVGKLAAGFLAANVIGEGFNKLSGFIGDSIAGFKEQMLVSAQTEAVIKSTGAAAGLSAKEIETMAGSLKNNSLFADDAIQSGENLLLTFTNIGKDTFPRATQAMVDMSQALGQDMKSSSIQLGKALNDPIQGITALSRVGVSFTEQQKEQIKAMAEAGDVAGAQALILAELEKEFGGSAKAASDAAGASAQYEDRMDDLQDTMGEKLLPVQLKFKEAQVAIIDFMISKAMPAFETISQVLQEKLAPAITVVVDFIKEDFIPAVEKFVSIAAPYIEDFSRIVGEQLALFSVYYEEEVKPALDNIIAGVEKVIGFIVEHWPEIEKIVRPVLEQVQLIVETSVKIIMDVLNILIQLIQGDFSGAWRGVQDLIATVWGLIEGTIENGKNFILGVLGVLKDVGIALLGGLLEGAKSRLGEIANWFWELPGKIVSQIPNPLNVLYSIGKQIMSGLLNGIVDGWNAVAGFVSGVAGKIASLKGPIEKDRKLLVPQGNAIMEGLDEGIQRGFSSRVAPTLSAITSEHIPAFAYGGGAGSMGGPVYNYNITVNAPNYLGSEQALFAPLMRLLVQAEQRGGLTPGVTRALS